MRNLNAAARAAPLHGLLATAALHALAAQKFDAETAPTIAPAATDLDTGQPLAIAFQAKKLGAVCVRVPDGPMIDDTQALKLLVGSTMDGKVIGEGEAKVMLARMKQARRDSAGPPIGVIRGKRVFGTDLGLGGGFHRRREVALN